MRAQGKQGRAKIVRKQAEPHTLHVELDGRAWSCVQEAAGLEGVAPRVWAAAALARHAGAAVHRRREGD